MNVSKTIAIGAVALVLTLGITTLAKAQDVSESPTQRPGLRAKLDERADKNREIRNDLLEKRAQAQDIREDARQQRGENASSSDMFKRGPKDVRADIKKRMEAKQFETRKAALIRELSKALEHLKDVRARIDSRITKAESEGRTMTEPKELLVIADQKIDVARIAIESLKNITSTSTAATASTTEIDLTKPRQVGDAAIKSVKEARDALQKVVISIAKNMGLKTGQKPPKSATSTPSVSVSPSPTATSTATSTGN